MNGYFQHQKNFVISGREQVEMFVNAIEESAKNRPVRIPVAASEITDDTELMEFMRMRKKTNDNK
ncbi:hypothetical protein [uncultured Bacteroides sp.]|uniref:hypothetical protein n=1 Tax=uncultured Bacteroides sp. TaxID=162156 RepID=UPI002592DEBE|nr:hypothetical protein [uncultured Bacteroides sp.]